MSIPLVDLKHETCTVPVDDRVDFIENLPLEVSQMILDKLDTRSLLHAAQVSHSWLFACKSRPAYRSRIHDYIAYLNDAWEEYIDKRTRYRTERMKERCLQVACLCLLGTFLLFCTIVTVSIVSNQVAGRRLIIDPYPRLAASSQWFG